jgi:glycosyltransferase involved in cell wall biosynthesis
MKICYCTLGFPPATGLGGPTLNAYYLTKALVARGHAVTVICTNLASKHEKLFPETRRLWYEGVDVIYFNTYRLFPLGLHSFGLFVSPNMIGFLKRELRNYDLLHLDGYRSSDVLMATHFCRKHNIPYVIQSRGTMRPAHSSLLAKRTYDVLFGRRILEGCALFIASSAHEVSDYNGFIRPSQSVVVIPNGINLAEYVELPEKGAFRRRHGIVEPKVVTYLGRVHAQKGIDHLLRAFAGSRFRRQSRLVIIGPDDGYRTKLMSLAQELGLGGSITFVDSLRGGQKLQAYVDADTVVYAGKTESFGMVPFEAAMCGVPTITSEGSACGELLTSFGAGFVVPYGDAPKLTQAIDAILENRRQAAQKVWAAREKIKEQLSWERIARQYEEAYQSVLRAPGIRPGGCVHN